jgi:hypothetical protein
MDTNPHLYRHRATGFEHEGVKSLAQGDTPATMRWVRTPDPGVVDSRQESHNRDTVPYSFQMIGEGL